MPTSIEEQKDLDVLHKKQAEEYKNFSLSCQYVLEMDETALIHSGFKSIENALFYFARAHKDKLVKMVKDHLKKWPD